MTKNICTIDAAAPVQGSVFGKAADLLVKVWFGADPGAPHFAAETKTARRPGPVLHRLPDLRKFGPNIV
jgi:hypothetical protein